MGPLPHIRVLRPSARHAAHVATLLTVTALVQSGGGTARGASSAVVVTADIPTATTLNATACAPNIPNITNFGIVQPGSVAKTSADCSVTFGSSNDTASLRVTQSDGVGSAMSHPTDTWTRHTGTSSRLSAVDSFGLMTWAIGSSGIGVRRSQDGGATWDPGILLAGAGNPTSISVPTTMSAWAGGDGSGTVWRTTNATAGTPTWTATAASTGISVRGVAATSATTAWVVGDAGAIRMTTDGGASWTPQTWSDAPGGAPPSSTILVGIEAFDADSLVAHGHGGRVLATSNGGTTWRDISTGTGAILVDVAQDTDSNVVVVGYDGTLVHTTNATNATPTWTARETHTHRAVRGVEYVDANNLVAVGDDGLMLRSTDGAATWTLGDVDAGVEMHDVTTPVAGTNVAVGAGMNIVRTTDSGNTWTYALDGANSWMDVSMTTDRTGWRVGTDGAIDRTTTGGTSWVSQTSNTALDLFGVYAFDPQHAVAVGRGGSVVTTSNGGGTWTVRAAGTTVDLEKVKGAGDGTAWAVGAAGTILRTNDRGATWTTQQTTAGELLIEVFAASTTSVVTVGRGGKAYYTTNGATWSNVALPSGTTPVRGLSGDRVTGAMFYITTSVYRSTDGGATWTLRGTPIASGPIEAVTDRHLVVVRAGGAPDFSTDAGATWTTSTAGSVGSHWALGVDSVDRTTAVVVGDGNLSGTTGSTSDIDNYVQNTSDWIGDGTEAFGMCLRSTTATATWPTEATCDQSADGAHWRAVPMVTDLTAEAAHTALGDGLRVANFRFGLRVSPSEPPGELAAGITFVVVAPAV